MRVLCALQTNHVQTGMYAVAAAWVLVRTCVQNWYHRVFYVVGITGFRCTDRRMGSGKRLLSAPFFNTLLTG
jgi:hypothetical protein